MPVACPLWLILFYRLKTRLLHELSTASGHQAAFCHFRLFWFSLLIVFTVKPRYLAPHYFTKLASPLECYGQMSCHVSYLDKMPSSPLALATTWMSLVLSDLTSVCHYRWPVVGHSQLVWDVMFLIVMKMFVMFGHGVTVFAHLASCNQVKLTVMKIW